MDEPFPTAHSAAWLCAGADVWLAASGGQSAGQPGAGLAPGATTAQSGGTESLASARRSASADPGRDRGSASRLCAALSVVPTPHGPGGKLARRASPAAPETSAMNSEPAASTQPRKTRNHRERVTRASNREKTRNWRVTDAAKRFLNRWHVMVNPLIRVSPAPRPSGLASDKPRGKYFPQRPAGC